MKQPNLVEELISTDPPAGFEMMKGGPATPSATHMPPGLSRTVYEGWLPTWAQNAARNFDIVNRAWSTDVLHHAADGIPAIICGIGPSLDADIEWLKKAGGHAIILSTDAALRPLLANGITPHLVLAYDCREQNATMFDGLPTESLVLVANSCAHPRTLAAWKGKILFFNMAQMGSQFCEQVLPAMFPKTIPLSNAGTVGNVAVVLAVEMGCGPLILSGMDLCYQKTADGVYRYRCTDYEYTPPSEVGQGMMGGAVVQPANWKAVENKVLYDNDERLKDAFKTTMRDREFMVDPPLDYYRGILVDFIGTQNLETVNTAAEGILSPLMPTMTLKKALADFCQVGIRKGQSLVPYMGIIAPDHRGGRS